MILAPCLNCEKRHMNCHSSCIDYLAFKKEKEIEHEKLEKIRQSAEDWYGYKQFDFKKISEKDIIKRLKIVEMIRGEYK